MVPDKGDDESASPTREPLYASVPDEKERHRILDEILAKREAQSRRHNSPARAESSSEFSPAQRRSNAPHAPKKAENPGESARHMPSTESAEQPLDDIDQNAASRTASPPSAPKDSVPARSAMREAAERREAAKRHRGSSTLGGSLFDTEC